MEKKDGGEKMRIHILKKDRIVCIDNGKVVSEKVIKPAVKDKKRSMK